jgi:hypothetical protein
MAQFTENIELLNGTGITLRLTNGAAEAIAGGNGASGILRLYRPTDDNTNPAQAAVFIAANQAMIAAGGQNQNGNIILKAADGTNRIVMSGALADITAGGNGANGDLVLKSNDNKNRVRLLGDANLWLGGNGADADIVLFRSNGDNTTLAQATAHLDGQGADLFLGGNGVNGDIHLKSDKGANRARLLGDGNLWLGGNGGDGDIVIFKSDGDNNTLEAATIHLDGQAADLRLGCRGAQGDITLKSDSNQNRVRLLGDANLWLGGNGADGDIVIFKSTGDNNTLEDASIHLDGQSGNIRCNDVNIPGADFAEDFDIDLAIADTLEPGTVMVLGRDGRLHESTEAFDRKVAGVVSGAGKYRVGITLDKQPNSINRMPIALSGKVMCKVDASFGPIEIGDLITTSPRKGHAMKATDPYKSFGAVIGKALADFPQGDGLLPILVALQ